MDSLTRGSGIAVSVLVAATASILLLLPARPVATPSAGATSGGITTASAAATSSPVAPRPRAARPATRPPAPQRRSPGSRPACRAAGGRGSRAWRGPGRRPGLRLPGRRAGAGRARIMSYRQTALPSGGSRAAAVIPRNPPGPAPDSSNVMPCSTARSWPPSWQATRRDSKPPTTATRRVCMPTASPCSPSPPTRPTPSRTRSSSPRGSFPRSATRTASGPGCTRWRGTSAAGGSGPRAAPRRCMRRTV